MIYSSHTIDRHTLEKDILVMSVMQDPQSSPLSRTDSIRFWMLAAILFLVTMAVIMFLFSLAYLDDLNTLRSAPELVWSFVCGQPTENGVTLPLLLTISTLAVLTSGVLAAGRWWLGRDSRKSH